MMRWLVWLLVVGCEKAPASTQEPAPEPTPVPAPVPTPSPIEKTLPGPDDGAVILAGPTAIWLGRTQILDLAPTTTSEDIKLAVEVALKSSKLDRDGQILLKADKSLVYKQVVAIIDGAVSAGFKSVAMVSAP